MEDKIFVKGFLLTRSESLFRHLYRKHSIVMYRLALQLTNKDLVGAEDIVQETWLRAIESLQSFKWNSTLRTWLCGILINCAREHLRKKGSSIINVIHPSFESPQGEWKIDLQNALWQLPLGYREVLLLHDLQGYKHHEIASMLGISEGTSKSQLFHARKAMQKFLN
jgi:RNA polymerase sigma-70 factor, ECF subfamily